MMVQMSIKLWVAPLSRRACLSVFVLAVMRERGAYIVWDSSLDTVKARIAIVHIEPFKNPCHHFWWWRKLPIIFDVLPWNKRLFVSRVIRRREGLLLEPFAVVSLF